MQENDYHQNREIEPTSDLLVLPDFNIDIISEIESAATTNYPGYPSPSERLHMSPEEIETWQERGGKTSDLPVGKYTVMDHPNYLRGITKGTALFDDGRTNFSSFGFLPTAENQGYKRDERGLPIRPYDEVFLQKGAVEGIGFYRNYGPNLTADPVVFRQKDEKLQVLVIERGDTGITALPGGMQDPKEPFISTAMRELFEEAGVDLHDTPHEIIHQGIVWSDTRSTRHAWPETTVVLLTPEVSKTDQMIPHAGDDAKHAKWININTKNLDSVFSSHASYIKLSVLNWQKKTGLKVLTTGSLEK